MDGGYNNDPLNNIGQPMPFPDALEEFKVESGVRPARYGVYTGADRERRDAFRQQHVPRRRRSLSAAITAQCSIGHFDIADDGLVSAQTGGTSAGR